MYSCSFNKFTYDPFVYNIYIYIYIYILPYPGGVEFSGEEVIVLPLVPIASLFVVALRSRLPLNGCM